MTSVSGSLACAWIVAVLLLTPVAAEPPPGYGDEGLAMPATRCDTLWQDSFPVVSPQYRALHQEVRVQVCVHPWGRLLEIEGRLILPLADGTDYVLRDWESLSRSVLR